jgi:diacylglycerol kinase family enzyme
VPHPDIDYRRVPAVQATFDRPLTVRLDGEAMGRVLNLSVRIEPEALRLAV